MARTFYGGSTNDVIEVVTADDGDLAPAAATMTVWTAQTGGTQVTDLLDGGSNAVTSITTSPPRYRVAFYGPDGYTAPLWVQGPDGERWRFDPADLAARVGGVSSVQVNAGTPATGAVTLNIPTIDGVEDIPGLPELLDGKVSGSAAAGGDALVRNASVTGALVKLFDTSTNRTVYQRDRQGLVTRNGRSAREVIGWRTGDPDPTAAGTIPLPSNVLYILLLGVGETVPTWAEGVSIVVQATA